MNELPPDLELLWIPVDDLLSESVDEGLRVEEEGTVGQRHITLPTTKFNQEE